jgi:hypothetical protein
VVTATGAFDRPSRFICGQQFRRLWYSYPAAKDEGVIHAYFLESKAFALGRDEALERVVTAKPKSILMD